jgi:glucose-6-phosphate isomerase
LVLGIGGSYIGAKSAIDFLRGQFYNHKSKDTPSIYFAGNNISSDYLNDIIEIIKDKDICINVISKSGTTTEPAIAFRIFKELLINKYGETEAAKRIYATTDRYQGALKKTADKEGYETFVIPDDIGGRYSVLTAVGLLPMAVCGIDIDMVLRGAKDAYHDFLIADFSSNACFKYAVVRNYFINLGRFVEIFASYEPKVQYFGEWLKQLFAESEGKQHKGIFPVFSLFSTDLHSIGQYIQDGLRNQFETILWIENPNTDYILKKEKSDIDKLNYLADKGMNFINKQAFLGASIAHTDGQVPNIVISIEKSDEYHYGYLVYFFMKSCALSGYILGVNPFDQLV